jgi:hypothetical protein
MDRPLVAIDLRLPDKLVLRLPPSPPGPQPAETQKSRSSRG